MKPKELFYFVLYLVMIVSLLMTIGSRDVAEEADEDLIKDMVSQIIQPPQVFVPDSTLEWDAKKTTSLPLIVLRADRPEERESLRVSFVGDGVAQKCSLMVDGGHNWSLSINPQAFSAKDTAFEVTLASRGIRRFPDSFKPSTYELMLELIQRLNKDSSSNQQTIVLGDSVQHKYYVPDRYSETKFRVVARSLGEKKKNISKIL
jgi:hypothetical protein